ncbi:NAD(P)-dependent oxidoreductase [Variovorax ginsengisoli]|uniref:3-hydroxyisobutyrate dehydrogenase-like beta-hydroxyacid dehydrogenase n=1 Tax=Variovorax ginsengisoli TaxID=363844 RepID=A0ABT9S803_9BURK|nr:NAD(P)-dependent oxidoreductase [Variovorax ginsengisoli]MDP9900003.1 3-hydroxyisobutyrate dehydrogenase-like beta-hydroxyacid dehydrogenase [Variovorax ginsengisoli]
MTSSSPSRRAFDRSLPVGLIGLGLVGTALAQRLTQAGFEVVGFDMRADARDALHAQGLRVAASPREVGAVCPVVVLAVFDTAGAIEAIEGPDGLASGGALRAVIDCSTGIPEALEALAQRLGARHIDLVEAPLSGSSRQIAAGDATLLLGGNGDAIEALAPWLSVLSSKRVHVGGAGAGARAKLATNLVLGLNRAALAEGMVFAESMGIAPARFLELVLATPARSDAALAKGAMMVNEDFTPQSRIRQHLKDVDLMLGHGQRTGQRLPLSETHAALMRAAVAAGDGELDNAAILRQLRRERTPPTPTDTH